jgi:putative transposase
MGINNKIPAGYAYYLTLTIEEWVDVFSRPVYKHIMVDSLNYCISNKGLEVNCWCLMSNHLHLIASAKEGGNLSDILRDFKKFTSKALINAIKEFP